LTFQESLPVLTRIDNFSLLEAHVPATLEEANARILNLNARLVWFANWANGMQDWHVKMHAWGESVNARLTALESSSGDKRASTTPPPPPPHPDWAAIAPDKLWPSQK
jgi:hypothetical protein